MITKYFSIFDSKTLMYGQVFPSLTFGSAERSFKESVENPESAHAKHPSDFALWFVFDIDDENGLISTNDPKQLVTAEALLPPY